MAFKLDDIIIDRIQYGVAEANDKIQYVLTQLSEATINITAESTDAVDATGTLVKRFYRGKSGEFSATNAMLNLNIVGAASGEGKVALTSGSNIPVPKIITVKAGQTATLTGALAGTIVCNALGNNGAVGDAFEQSTQASTTEFGYSTSTKVFTAPNADGVEQYIVKFDRDVTDGIMIRNRADKFPGTVKLTLKALCVDPCSVDTLRACYIVLPSFQVSPETEISLSTDGTLSYNGVLQVDYCSSDKALYYIYMAEEDEE